MWTRGWRHSVLFNYFPTLEVLGPDHRLDFMTVCPFSLRTRPIFQLALWLRYNSQHVNMCSARCCRACVSDTYVWYRVHSRVCVMAFKSHSSGLCLTKVKVFAVCAWHKMQQSWHTHTRTHTHTHTHTHTKTHAQTHTHTYTHTHTHTHTHIHTHVYANTYICTHTPPRPLLAGEVWQKMTERETILIT